MTSEEFVRLFDSLLEKDMTREAGELLGSVLSEAEKEHEDALRLTVLNEMTGFYRSTGDAARGLEAARDVIDAVHSMKLSETVTGATCLLNAATTMKAFGRTRESLPLYEEAERIYERFLAPGDYRFAGLCNNMALALTELGAYERAEKYFLSAMAVLEELPSGKLETAVTLVNMACLYDRQGRGEKAVSGLLLKAWEYFDDPLIARDPYYAFNCRKCAGTFDHYGFFAMKDELLERAEKIYRKEA